MLDIAILSIFGQQNLTVVLGLRKEKLERLCFEGL
jgi:hypothetical protein